MKSITISYDKDGIAVIRYSEEKSEVIKLLKMALETLEKSTEEVND